MVAATGIGSGLDIEGLVTQLVQAERGPAESRLLQQETQLTSELSAFGTLQGALNSLQSSVTSLATSSTFDQRSASSSNSDAVSASVTSGAAAGSFSVAVDSLAQAQSLASESFANVTDTVGEGTLTLRFGTASVTPPDSEPQSFDSFTVNADRASATITIDSSNNSLQGVRDAINEADIGVSAAIVNDGNGFRLLLSSQQTGTDNAIEIAVDDSGDGNDADASGLSRLAFNTSANNLTQTVEAQDASFSINGLALTSDSNVVNNVVDGVNLTLSQTTDAAATVTISENTGAVRSSIESFVSSFNNFASVAGNLTSYNAESQIAGPLQGDFTARSIVNQIRAALADTADGFNGPFSTLAELGITTQADGTLSINDSTLDAALEDNFDAVAAVFARVGNASDSGVRFESATDSTQNRSFAVEITQLATQGSLAGAAISEPSVGSPLVIDDSNDTFSITVNGVSSDSISITQGSFSSGAELAAELQARINGDTGLSNANISVTVDFTDDFRFEITSSRFGSASTVEIDSVDSGTAASLGLDTGAGTDGVDVAGTIGGVVATGSGQRLSAATGSDAEGLSISIIGGSTGSRGSVNVSAGVAVSLNGILENFLSSDGLIDLRTDGLQSSVDDIADDREALNSRLDALEARLRSQFNALDTLLANLQTTSDFLSTQLAAIPIPGVNNDN
ncbi:MAG: flagellar filament capping protein FliD [Pseudomonadota bacterium]